MTDETVRSVLNQPWFCLKEIYFQHNNAILFFIQADNSNYIFKETDPISFRPNEIIETDLLPLSENHYFFKPIELFFQTN